MNKKALRYDRSQRRGRHVKAVGDHIRSLERPHVFVMFRTGEDVCGVCGKPRAEHRTTFTR